MRRVFMKPLACFLAILLLLPAMPVALAASNNAFTDVSSSAWYYSDIQHMAQEGLMEGVGGGSFAPDAPLTRAMFVTILGRIEYINADYYAKATSFGDVKAGSWYAPYVAWAAKNGITNGISATEFAPDVNITREQMATLIARYVNKFGVSLGKTDHPAEKFRDTDAIADYATSAVELMRQTGIIIGDGENFLPRNNATRAQAAAVFSRLIFATPEDYGTPVEGVDYKITYVAANSFEDNFQFVLAIGVVENIGDKTMNIRYAAVDVFDERGILLTDPSVFLSCPQVLTPGQKSYLYKDHVVDEVNPDQNFRAEFTITAEFTREPAVRYDVSDVTFCKAEFHEIDALGYVTNNMNDVDDIHVAVVLFDSDKKPVGIVEEWVYDVSPGATESFRAEGVFLPPDITLDDVSSYAVFAYPW